MLRRTSTQTAPWVIIRSGAKQRARRNAIKVILNAVDYEGRTVSAVVGLHLGAMHDEGVDHDHVQRASVIIMMPAK